VAAGNRIIGTRQRHVPEEVDSFDRSFDTVRPTFPKPSTTETADGNSALDVNLAA